MTDRITKEHRSWNMSRIRSKDTKTEKAVRSMLHNMGYRFRLHVKELAGKPDIVLPKYKTIIFIHGCYWHRHPGCKYAYTPKSRVTFWEKKFKENVRRDEKNQLDLKKLNWKVMVIWECELSDLEMLRKKLGAIRIDSP
ncbi:MAG: DNA mismatch endonuclease Vsr [Desulfobacterales bacterium]|nr:DNA mismatch endonuclease Vsr [Desulfobacterales bacterium]